MLTTETAGPRAADGGCPRPHRRHPLALGRGPADHLNSDQLDRLLGAGVIPGLALAAVFSATVALVCMLRPTKAGG